MEILHFPNMLVYIFYEDFIFYPVLTSLRRIKLSSLTEANEFPQQNYKLNREFNNGHPIFINLASFKLIP